MKNKYLPWTLLILASLWLCSCGSAPKSARPSVDSKNTFAGKQHYRPTTTLAKTLFRWPLQAPLSSGYGPRWGRFHSGIDIDGEAGDNVLAAADGKVIFSGYYGAYGNYIVVQHPEGFFTAYAHNQKNLIKAGEAVRAGQLIAKVGATGSATGAHLHFEIRDSVGTYDPSALLPKTGARSILLARSARPESPQGKLGETLGAKKELIEEQHLDDMEFLPQPGLAEVQLEPLP